MFIVQMLDLTKPIAVEQPLSSSGALLQFQSEKPHFFEALVEHVIVQHCQRYGITSDFLGHVPPAEISFIGPECRDHFFARGLNSRQRAVCDAVVRFIRDRGLSEPSAKIYAHEAVTPLALAMRGRFARFIGTEYARDDKEREDLFPILHGDICALDFADDAFHVIISCEVFEHVPDIDAALRESVRILKPGGRFIGTFPFLAHSEQSIRLACLEQGRLVHLVDEPIYHGNPMDPSGSLVFELPGWDIINRALAAGFSSANMTFICDQTRGVVASSIDQPIPARGVFLAIFDK
jgi:SAM-dependent methyltransferase